MGKKENRNPETRAKSRAAQNLRRQVERRIKTLAKLGNAIAQREAQRLQSILPKLKKSRGTYDTTAQAAARTLLKATERHAQTSNRLSRLRKGRQPSNTMSNEAFKEEMRKMARGQANALTQGISKRYNAGSDEATTRYRNRMANRMFFQAVKQHTRGQADQYQAMMDYYGTDSLMDIWDMVTKDPQMKKTLNQISRATADLKSVKDNVKRFRELISDIDDMDVSAFWEDYDEYMASFAG